jgi:hypothetical protein
MLRVYGIRAGAHGQLSRDTEAPTSVACLQALQDAPLPTTPPRQQVLALSAAMSFAPQPQMP